MGVADCGKSSNRIPFGTASYSADLDKGFSPHERNHLQLSPAEPALSLSNGDG